MKKLFLLSILLTSLYSSHSAPFRNLDFEEANTNHLLVLGPYYVGAPEELLPGWQVYDNTNVLTTVGYNSVVDFGPWIAGPTLGTSPVNYHLAVYLGWYHSFSIVQQGDVPLGAIGLTYTSTGFPLDVSVNGIPLQHSLAAPYYDVSAFAGQQNVELKIATTGDPGPVTFLPIATLDDISFIIFVESDFNDDGAPDVVFEHQNGSLGAWFMNKGPDLISASLFKPETIDPRWHVVGTGDFNRDRKTDLLLQQEDGTLAVWFMNGTNSISAAPLNPSQPGEGWKVVGTGDMNRDGKKDILFQHTDGTLGVWFMDGINLVNGALLSPNKPGDSGWRVVGTAHLINAGNTDLIFQHTDGTLAAWYMDGTNLVRGALLNPSVPGEEGWRVAATLDLNGDGKTDLLFQHDDGRVAVWFMDGIDLLSGHLFNPENPGNGWRIAGPR